MVPDPVSARPSRSAWHHVASSQEVANVNKSQLVEQVAARTKSNPADVARIVNSVLDVVSSSVAKGDKVVLSGFGTFHRHARGRRVARNLWTDQKVVVPPTNVPAFRPGKPFKERVAKARRRRTSTPPAKA